MAIMRHMLKIATCIMYGCHDTRDLQMALPKVLHMALFKAYEKQEGRIHLADPFDTHVHCPYINLIFT